MSESIENRYEFVYLFDVTNGNPNGDPDAGNAPRQDFETGKGLVTDVCLKRKIRNYVDMAKENRPPFEIHVREGAFLSEHHKRAHLAIEKESVEIVVPDDLIEEFKTVAAYPDGIFFDSDRNRPCLVLSLSELEDAEKKIKAKGFNKLISAAAKAVLRELFVDSKEKRAAQWMCKNFFDVRTFGAVMSTGDARCGQIRGPVQLGFAESIEPIVSKEISMSRTAAVKIDDPLQKGLGASKSIVPYGLYRVHGYISAHLATQTGFDNDDLEILWEALQNMFDHDPAAARTGMNARNLFVFKHNSKLGNAQAHKLFDSVKIERTMKDGRPARSFGDYQVELVKAGMPEEVQLIKLL